jgi:hypothetical protein
MAGHGPLSVPTIARHNSLSRIRIIEDSSRPLRELLPRCASVIFLGSSSPMFTSMRHDLINSFGNGLLISSILRPQHTVHSFTDNAASRALPFFAKQGRFPRVRSGWLQASVKLLTLVVLCGWLLWKERDTRSFEGRSMQVPELVALISQTRELWNLAGFSSLLC